jgi:hypothetical protein
MPGPVRKKTPKKPPIKKITPKKPAAKKTEIKWNQS